MKHKNANCSCWIPSSKSHSAAVSTVDLPQTCICDSVTMTDKSLKETVDLLVIRPDCRMVVQVVCQMVWNEIFAGYTEIDRVERMKLLSQPLEDVLRYSGLR